MSNQYVEKGLRSPVNLTWEVTLACNLRCRHCLSSSAEPAEGELSTEEALALVEQLHGEGVFQINFGGGEPFMRPDFLHILDACHELGIMTCISTNGTLITPELVERLSRNRLVAIQVSLDGAQQSTCEAIRGKGTFNIALKALELLAKSEIPTSINTVLTRENADEIQALQDLAGRIGVTLRISRFRPSGRGADNWQELRPTPTQLLAFSAWLAKNQNVRTGDSFFSLTSQERQGLGLNLCGAAKLTCCVSPTGMVYPCAFLQSDRFEAGNLRKNSFKEIWDNSEIFASFRGLRIHSCEDCQRFDQCHGGCPAVAYHLKDDIEGGDPECLERCVTSIADAKADVSAA
ncbi:mycofactocin radical SAM maturase [Geopsychrobacter electrodiphilus]|uniref:mycofactocin radical SAM maturase n=1 Tax=Geopsychrobacter electrodiphilus TaxID=225196 RepID=UPI0003608122|nr:mycofactocin radical SAM maturase [Geopsychrobacter electrodiphilus]